ncbi:hypothetical protein M407DRAFT_25821, partial [Tulasnella calospora MUT 4182]
MSSSNRMKYDRPHVWKPKYNDSPHTKTSSNVESANAGNQGVQSNNTGTVHVNPAIFPMAYTGLPFQQGMMHNPYFQGLPMPGSPSMNANVPTIAAATSNGYVSLYAGSSNGSTKRRFEEVE